MAQQVVSDGKEVTLWEMVDMCKDCASFCHEKTRRVVEDVGVKIWGFGWKFDEIRETRRQEEQASCEKACAEMLRSCPASTDIRRAVESGSSSRVIGAEGGHMIDDETLTKQSSLRTLKKSKDGRFYKDTSNANAVSRGLFGDWVKAPNEDEVLWPVREYENAEDHEGLGGVRARMPTPFQLRRCEQAAERFSQTLLSIATKPTKVVFERNDDEVKSKFLAKAQDTFLPEDMNKAKHRAPPSEGVQSDQGGPRDQARDNAIAQEVDIAATQQRIGRGAMPPPIAAMPAKRPTQGHGTVVSFDEKSPIPTKGTGKLPVTVQRDMASTQDPVDKREMIKVDEDQLNEYKAWSRSAAEGIAYEDARKAREAAAAAAGKK